MEDKFLEYKEAIDPHIRRDKEKIVKEVIAFLNTSGGKIKIGVDDNGRAIGLNIDDFDAYILSLQNTLQDSIRPQTTGLIEIMLSKELDFPTIDILIAEGKALKPYFYEHYGLSPRGVFYRLNSAAVPMPQEMIEQLFKKRDNQTLESVSSPTQQLQFEYLEQLLLHFKMSPNEHLATNLGLVNDSGFNYTAYLLSDECSLDFDYIEYEGTTKSIINYRKTYTKQSILKTFKDLSNVSVK